MNPWESYYTSEDPLFRVGNVPVYITTILVALQVLAMVVFAVIGYDSPLIFHLSFTADALVTGRLWTLITYAFVDTINFFSALSLVFFYLFGLRVEMRLGTNRYLKLLAILILGPTLFLSVVGLITGLFHGVIDVYTAPFQGGNIYSGSMNVRLCVLIAVSWFNSEALFWPGIKAKWMGIFFVALSALQYLGGRQWMYFWMCWFSLLLAYITLRRMGMAMKFAPVEESLLNLIPKRRPKGYRSSKRKLKVVKEAKGGRKVQYDSKLAPKVEAATSTGPAASVDHLLEKISKEGISSLTDKERKLLESASNQLSSDDDKPSS
jgi:membrane associated rhomboid family serine protease